MQTDWSELLTFRMGESRDIVVPWEFGTIKQLIEEGTWESFNDRQKNLWLTEMNKTQNLSASVRFVPRMQLVELFFHRVIPSPNGAGATASATYVAGKWVRLANFQVVLAEAEKF